MKHTEYNRKRRRRGVRRLLPAAVCIALIAFGAGKLIAYFARSHSVKQTNAALQEIYEQTPSPAALLEATAEAVSPETLPSATVPPETVLPEARLRSEYQSLSGEMLPRMRELFEKNGDLVAWVRIPGVVSLPVVYRDNTYYLNHDFGGKSSPAGTLFLDERHPLTVQTQHLLIHGHNMHDGSMFGLLSHYRGLDYVLEHGLVSLSTLYREETYALFAVLIVPDDPGDARYVPYAGTAAFQSEGQFNAFIRNLRENSLYAIPIDVQPGDALLTLSTCLDEDKLVLVCRRMRDGETEETLRQALNQSTRR